MIVEFKFTNFSTKQIFEVKSYCKHLIRFFEHIINNFKIFSDIYTVNTKFISNSR